jgi:flagellar biosynthesis/type III secretory pathway protein FliH
MSYIEKEKLIKADIASIEKTVRHAFNQGYDLGYKEGKSKQEPKIGHWIEITNNRGTVIALRCSRCEKSPKYAIKSDFCPSCGADMRESEE